MASVRETQFMRENLPKDSARARMTHIITGRCNRIMAIEKKINDETNTQEDLDELHKHALTIKCNILTGKMLHQMLLQERLDAKFNEKAAKSTAPAESLRGDNSKEKKNFLTTDRELISLVNDENEFRQHGLIASDEVENRIFFSRHAMTSSWI